MGPIKILRQYHQAELSDAGTIVRLVRVDFKIGDDGPFNISIPEDQFTADTLIAKVQAVADNIEKVRDAFRGTS